MRFMFKGVQDGYRTHRLRQCPGRVQAEAVTLAARRIRLRQLRIVTAGATDNVSLHSLTCPPPFHTTTRAYHYSCALDMNTSLSRNYTTTLYQTRSTAPSSRDNS
jgi:hypothetical protein